MEVNDEILKNIILEKIAEISPDDIYFYAQKNKTILEGLYRHNFITDKLIENALEQAVINEAISSYQWMMDKISKGEKVVYADHIGGNTNLACFAYALDQGIFSKEEIKKIPFDKSPHHYSKNKDEFIKRYKKLDLISKLRTELLNPESYPIFLTKK